MDAAQKAKQLASMPERSIPRGDTYGQRQYLKSISRQREQSMRQFLKTDGPAGNTDAFREGWDRVFGKGRDS